MVNCLNNFHNKFNSNLKFLVSKLCKLVFVKPFYKIYSATY